MNKESIKTEVQQLHEEGYSIRGIAQKKGISKSSVGRIIKEIQDLNYGTAAGTHSMAVPVGIGTPGGTSEAVPEAGWDAHGTIEDDENSGDELENAAQQRQQAKNVFEEFMMRNNRQYLRRSYQDFLYSTRTFVTNNLCNEELARELIKSRRERVKDFIIRAKSICSSCQESYERLYMAYVLDELYFFLGQQPELVKTERDPGLQIKMGGVLEQFIKQVEYFDVFTPIENGVIRFPNM